MPFENFYNEREESGRRRRAATAWIFFAVSGYLIAAGIYFFGYYRTEREKRLANERRLESVDDLCRSIHSQTRLEFVRRDESVTDDKTATVVYRFRSYLKPEEIKQAYLPVQEMRFSDWLNETGWQPSGDSGLAFQRGSQTFALREIADETAGYELRCTETEISFGIY